MNKQGDLYINGKWTVGNGDSIVSYDPITQRVIATFNAAPDDQVMQAVEAARAAFRSWSALTLDQRLVYLNKFVDGLKDKKEEFADLISEETGKPRWESLTEVNAMINKLPISQKAYQERCLELSMNAESSANVTHFKPHGVVAVFGPFNLPGHLPNGHIIPALLAGNTVVFKPSELTPCVGHAYIELWEKTGLPNGVINLVQGGRPTGVSLSGQPDLDGLFFTGSSNTGKAIHATYGGQPQKILALEMGGNNPLVIGDIQNLKAASYMIIQSAFITSGQRCTCARRLIVQDNAQSEQLLDTLIGMAKGIRAGACTDTPEPFMGPVISTEAAVKVLQWQDKFVEQGAKVLLKMQRLDAQALLSPGIIDVTPLATREDVEIFGPLLQVVKVNSFDEALEEANRTRYGLSAGLLSNDAGQYEKFLTHSKAGVVNWNYPTTGASSKAPFGGVGESGNHRPSAYFAADYCSYPVASIENSQLDLPKEISPGINITEGEGNEKS